MILVPLLAASLAVAPGCDVTDATLEWGFKESFRSYISGSIADGGWVTDGGVAYETPSFTWSGGEGYYELTTGEVRFDGSVRFTGHDGLLDTTIANPVIRFDGEGAATMLLDVSGPTMSGEQIDETGVEFVELTGLELSGEDALLTGSAETVLTEAGAVAFPNYAAGEAFDPVTIELTFGDSCAPPVAGGDQGGDVVDPPEADGPQWPWLIGGIAIIAIPVLIVAGVVTALVVAARRRRRA